MQEFVRINALVKQAEALGHTLYHPVSGRALKYYDCKIIEPLAPLGDTLDFSQAAVQRSLVAGVERARQVLGGVRRGEHALQAPD
jgi:NTE family protein